MQILDLIHDLAIVLVFTGVAMLPRAVKTYFALRSEDIWDWIDCNRTA